MARLRFMAVALLALALAGNSTQTGRTEGQTNSPTVSSSYVPYASGKPDKSAADNRSCVIYSLTDMGYDVHLGAWIAQTIPEMIEPSSWKESGGAGVLRYYAPKNIMIVNHSAAVQTKVDGFLKNLKTSLPKGGQTNFAASKKSSHAKVVPAEYRAPTVVRASNPLPEPSSYPVPAPVKAPKHLFHFLIRYEGEGIVDDNVVKLMKSYAKTAMEQGVKVQTGGCPAGPSPSAANLPPTTTDAPSTTGPVAPALSGSAVVPGSSLVGPAPVDQPKQQGAKKKDDQKEKSDKESKEKSDKESP